MFTELVFKQVILENPVLRVKRPKSDIKNVRTTFENKEIRKLLNLYDNTKNLQELQNKSILAFMTLGQRVSTITNIKIKDINFIDGFYVITLYVKGGKIKHLPVPSHCAELYLKLKEKFNKKEDDYLFLPLRGSKAGINKPLQRSSVHKLIKRSLQKIGLCESRSAHSFKKFVLTQLLEDGHSTEEVADNVRFYTSLNTLNLYKVGAKKNLKDNPILKRDY